jgi:TolA-binding protein
VFDPKHEIELLQNQQAKLWNTIEELESLTNMQKQKIDILEHALLLGIDPRKQPTQKDKTELPKEEKALISQPLLPPAKVDIPTMKESSTEDQDFKRKLEEAVDLFQDKKIGQAYLLFLSLEKNFPPDVHQGAPVYWIGRCWLGLREFRQAEEYFVRLEKDYQNSPLTAESIYFQASMNYDLGFYEKSFALLKRAMEGYPDHEKFAAFKALMAKIQSKI